VTQDLVVEVIVDEDVGNFGVLKFGSDCVSVGDGDGVGLDCVADWLLDVEALIHVPSSAEHSEPGGQPVTRQQSAMVGKSSSYKYLRSIATHQDNIWFLQSNKNFPLCNTSAHNTYSPNQRAYSRLDSRLRHYHIL